MSPRRPQALPALALLLSGAALAALACGGGEDPAPSDGEPEDPYAEYAGSSACKHCHAPQYEDWRESHHALAERELDPARDAAAFEPGHAIAHGTQRSEARSTDGQYELLTPGLDSSNGPYPIARVFGVEPLRQFLIPAERGRYQVTELAWDPAEEEWFDVYGNEDRRPGEWGHWTGRGMAWNSMCAGCHNTRVRKNYDYDSDSYSTSFAEMGVGCEACHGPMKAHVEHQSTAGPIPAANDPTLPIRTIETELATCGSCHSRRGEITGDFAPGDRFLDHFLPVIPDLSDIYHADGQVRDEDFEFVSFLSSRMHGEGVRCLDCHLPHSAKLRAQGNDLCMRCHEERGIDPAAHSFHEPGTPGGNCVDCHMPLTTYMQRHPRRDHGFTIPDPLLTKEHGIPNACERCHADRGIDWMVEAAEGWWGERLERGTRQRSRTIAMARAGERAAVDGLLEQLATAAPLWKATAASLLVAFLDDERVLDALVEGLKDPEALVRSRCAWALELAATSGHPGAIAALEPLLEDPVRAVRVEAAWSLRDRLPMGSRAADDLVAFLEHDLDQPLGLRRMGVFHFERGETGRALPFLERAVELDPHSSPLRDSLAVVLSSAGRPAAAVVQLEKAVEADDGDADLWHRLGLARAEIGDLSGACEALEAAVARDAQHGRAWYNLGLARAQQGEEAAALGALARAEEVSPESGDPAYAAATVLYGMGNAPAAESALVRALERDAGHTGALQMLQQIRR